MKNFLTNNKQKNILFIITIIILSITMFFYIDKKEGFHEDEIFSYGSSNYKYDNLFQAAADRDSINRTLAEFVYRDNLIDTIKNAKYYLLDHKEIFDASVGEKIATDRPVWKTPSEAEDYVTVSKDDIFCYPAVYINQGRDVHPPLFYMLVHLVSTLSLNTFSKYIIFFINLIFFISTCIVIRKIFKLYNKEKLAIPTILLYGLSMGAISTVILLRMYSMLTFFCLLYLYINLKIVKNNFEIDKKLGIQLVITTILGFLTQYYFCIFAVLVFILMFIRLLVLKDKKKITKYILKHIKSAIIGLLLFVPSIYHIFFSYRGPGKVDSGNLIEQLQIFVKILFDAYSIPLTIGYILLACSLLYFVITLIIKIKKKQLNYNKLFEIFLITIPTILYIVIVSKISPKIDEKYMIRYIMPVLPMVAISFIVLMNNVFSRLLKFKNSKTKNIVKIITISTIVITLSIVGFFTNKPNYLYLGYDKYIEVAEKYKELNYVYICDNAFTYINSIPEFMIYNKTLILNTGHDSFDILGTDAELQSQDKFILSIKKWTNVKDSLNKVLEASGFSNYEVVLDNNDDTASIIYLISK